MKIKMILLLLLGIFILINFNFVFAEDIDVFDQEINATYDLSNNVVEIENNNIIIKQYTGYEANPHYYFEYNDDDSEGEQISTNRVKYTLNTEQNKDYNFTAYTTQTAHTVHSGFHYSHSVSSSDIVFHGTFKTNENNKISRIIINELVFHINIKNNTIKTWSPRNLPGWSSTASTSPLMKMDGHLYVPQTLEDGKHVLEITYPDGNIYVLNKTVNINKYHKETVNKPIIKKEVKKLYKTKTVKKLIKTKKNIKLFKSTLKLLKLQIKGKYINPYKFSAILKIKNNGKINKNYKYKVKIIKKLGKKYNIAKSKKENIYKIQLKTYKLTKVKYIYKTVNVDKITGYNKVQSWIL